MIVTTIIAILGMMASIPLKKARERAMVVAAKQEVRQALTAIAMYEALNARLPQSITDLDEVGYHEGGDVVFCTFNYNAGTRRREDFVKVEAKHEGAEIGVSTRFPLDDGMLSEKAMSNCKNVRPGESGGGKGGKKGGRKKG